MHQINVVLDIATGGALRLNVRQKLKSGCKSEAPLSITAHLIGTSKIP